MTAWECLKSSKWWKAVLVRVIKTMAETAIATIGTAIVLTDVNWLYVASATVLAGIITILLSLGGLPEVGSNNS